MCVFHCARRGRVSTCHSINVVSPLKPHWAAHFYT
uniref:Uncharacterized protein n=1 Tax=Anguilla anguilla TaxID=7936 RepID=A0A0E9W9M2_ANGAN